MTWALSSDRPKKGTFVFSDLVGVGLHQRHVSTFHMETLIALIGQKRATFGAVLEFLVELEVVGSTMRGEPTRVS